MSQFIILMTVYILGDQAYQLGGFMHQGHVAKQFR